MFKNNSQLFLAVLVLIGVVTSLYMIRAFFGVLVTAPILAIACYPIHRWISARVRSPAVAALFSTAAVALVGVVPLTFLLVIGFEQGRAVVARATEFVSFGGVEALLVNARPLLERLGLPELSAGDLQAWLAGHAESLGRQALSVLGTVAGSVLSSLGTVFFILFVLYFCFAAGASTYRRVVSFTPLSIQQANRLASTVRDAIAANVNGVLIVGLVQGGLTGVAFFFAGLPSAVFWGIVAGLASVLPPFGAAVVWLPGAIYLAVQGDYWRASLLATFGALVIASADNVIRPIVVGTKVPLGPLPILLSILGGLQTFGLIGLFLGPVLFAATVEAICMLREEWR